MTEKSNNPIRILNIVPNMRAAGIETFIMNVYRNIDRNKVQFDFLVHNKRREFFDDEIERLGGRIYRLSYKDDKNLFKYIKALNNFFKTHKEYKIVHGHMQSMMPLYLMIAKKNKIPVRIAHSHNGNFEKTLKGFILHIFSRFSKYFSTENLACSEIAGKYLFGNKKFEVIYNGIDIDKFKFDENIRNKKRKELNISDDMFVIGHIGRFELQKNHEFILKIFENFVNDNPNSCLVLIGEGRLEKKIKENAEKFYFKEKIKFLGVRNDINELYNVMDVFILPSLYEGLPVVGIEAQNNGVPCLFSNTITNELKINNNVKFLNLSKPEEWIKELKLIRNDYNTNRNIINKNKFDIKIISNKIQNSYLNFYTEL